MTCCPTSGAASAPPGVIPPCGATAARWRWDPPSPGHPLAAAGLEAAAQAGYRRAADISGGLEEGFGWCDLNIADGRRQSARDAYLSPALGRPNLDVVTGALVHRVRLEGDRCTGVDYSVGASVYFVRCTGEVVLAAGTVGSAQLLLRSGIGPQSDLRSVGIDVAADLPGVGANLFDHPMSGVVYRSARPVPAGQNNHGEVLGLIRSHPGADMPDLQVMVVDVPLRAGTLPGPAIGEGYTLATSLMLPRSRGTVRLASAEPGTPPLIDPNYYADPRDLQTFADGLRAAREIGRAAALDQWRGEEVLPGPGVNDDAGLRAYLRRNLQHLRPPRGNVPDRHRRGRRRRHRPARARHQRTPGGRRLRDALRPLREHQRHRLRHRRTRGRAHPGTIFGQPHRPKDGGGIEMTPFPQGLAGRRCLPRTVVRRSRVRPRVCLTIRWRRRSSRPSLLRGTPVEVSYRGWAGRG